MQSSTNHWGMQVAAGMLPKQAPSSCALVAAATRMASSPSDFVKHLGLLFLAATNEAQRRSVVALNPLIFQSIARFENFVWSAADAGFVAPSPGAGLAAFDYQHEDFGWLVCHLGVDDDEFFVSDVYLDAKNITHRMGEKELQSIVDAFHKHLEYEQGQSAMDAAALQSVYA